MALRSNGRKLSFEILATSSFAGDGDASFYRSNSDPSALGNGIALKPNKRKRKNKKKKAIECSIPESSTQLELDCKSYSVQTVVYEEVTEPEEGGASVCTVSSVAAGAELRQRSVVNDDVARNGGEKVMLEEESGGKGFNSLGKRSDESDGSASRKLDKEESLDWKRLMAEDPNQILSHGYRTLCNAYYLKPKEPFSTILEIFDSFQIGHKQDEFLRTIAF
ncbi:hypothetical protein RJ639_012724 [Escallonia herrerae]|uniref:Uncharacterized protein n=1 Tax=Escallonia herrerae TaxID=1293975 RepID=A0AA89AUA1_9ASTE|nr:hypothetical protein RJ639_012724 [Escallonia herrerae]